MRLSMPCYFFGMLVVPFVCNAGDFDLAATATNQLAVDLHRQLATGAENLCVSIYSIESALAMTFAGTERETRTEIARVLHLTNNVALPTSCCSLRRSL